MNVGVGGERRFALIHAETGGIDVLIDDPPGIGHPTLTDDSRFLLTDTYDYDAEPPLAHVRWVDLDEGRWRDLCVVPRPPYAGLDLCSISRRVDCHPALDRDGRRILFTAAPEGRRRLFVADPFLPPGREIEDLG
jgi:hypothetical protein